MKEGVNMELAYDFISEYGASILYTIITAVISFVGIRIKEIYQKFINDKTKQEVIQNTVKYIEQLYIDLSGTEKCELAKQNIIALLKEKKISITELELNVLIESACHYLKKGV